MSIDEEFVALMDRTLLSLDRTGVNGLPLRFFVRGFGPPLLDAVEAVGRVAVEPDGGGVGAMLTVLAETVGIVAAAVCSTPVGSCEDLYWLSWDEQPGNGGLSVIDLPLLKVLSH